MADVHVLPGIERRDLGEPVPSAAVLQAAIDAGVTDVIIVGRARDGQFYFAAECPDADAVIGKLMRGVATLADCEVVQK